MLQVQAHRLDEGAWRTWRPVWKQLLSQSRADRLFLDWDWQELWWKHWGARPDEEAYLCVVTEGSEVRGALPIVVGQVRRRPGFRLLSVQVMGARHADPRSILSEYLDVVAVEGCEATAREAIMRHVRERFGPGEFSIGWTPSGAAWTSALVRDRDTYVREVSHERSYRADLQNGFKAYADSLGASTRRSLLNQRRRLDALGPVRLVSAGVGELPDAIEELNRLHALRWGAPAFTGNLLAFHHELMARWAPLGRVVLSRLLVGSRCVSSLYDLRVGTTQYNIQLGFDAGFSPKLSIGLLHIGYAMEQAAVDGVHTYDLLVGRGKNSDYKNALASERLTVVSLQALRDRWATPLYRLVDGVRDLRQLRKPGPTASP